MDRTTHRLAKLVLLGGYAGLTVALVVAHRSPVTGYELSLYAATPALTWLGLGVGLVAGGTISFGGQGRVREAALGLVTAVALAVFAMPVLRGYTFYGAGDSLSHVGWARELLTGALEPTELLYPGIHALTVFLSSIADVPLALSNIYIVLVAVPLVFLLFVPASVELLTVRPGGYAVGLLAAAAFFPINNIAVHASAHPASQGTLLFAFVLYLALATVDGVLDSQADEREAGQLGRSLLLGAGGLFSLALVAMVLIHPQQALNVGAFLLGIVGLQLLVRRRWPTHSIAAGRSLIPHTALLFAAFMMWAPRFPRVRSAIVGTLQGLLASGGTGAAVVADKSTSLAVIGGSVTEIFLKLFGVATLLSLVAAVVLLVALRHHRRNPLVLLVGAGLVPVFGVFLLMIAANASDMYFRYHGFLMVPVTVLGAVGLARLSDGVWTPGGRRAGATVALVLLLVLAPAGLLAVHSSPYIYQPSQHVTEGQVEGYAAAFDHRQEGMPFTGLRGGPRRYVDYHYGTQQARDTLEFPGYRTGVPPSVFAAGNHSDAFDERRYLATTDAAHQREVRLYEGFRYPEREFRGLETTPGVDRVRANDGFRLYTVGEEEE